MRNGLLGESVIDLLKTGEFVGVIVNYLFKQKISSFTIYLGVVVGGGKSFFMRTCTHIEAGIRY